MRWEVIQPDPQDTPPSQVYTAGVGSWEAGQLVQHARLPVTESEYAQYAMAAAVGWLEDALQCSLLTRTIRATFYSGELLELPRGPVISIVSIEDDDENDLSTGYRLQRVGHTDTLTLASSARPVHVVYTAGYAAELSGLPPVFRQMALMIGAAFYEQREALSDRPLAIPPHVQSWIAMNRHSAGVG